MYATQRPISSNQPPLQAEPRSLPVQPPASRASRRQHLSRQRRQQSYVFAIATETFVKLTVNVLLLLVFTSALRNLVPQMISYKLKLDEVNAEVALTERRVQQLQANFEQAFDAQQEHLVIQQESYLRSPQERSVIWLQPTNGAEP